MVNRIWQPCFPKIFPQKAPFRKQTRPCPTVQCRKCGLSKRRLYKLYLINYHYTKCWPQTDVPVKQCQTWLGHPSTQIMRPYEAAGSLVNSGNYAPENVLVMEYQLIPLLMDINGKFQLVGLWENGIFLVELIFSIFQWSRKDNTHSVLWLAGCAYVCNIYRYDAMHNIYIYISHSIHTEYMLEGISNQSSWIYDNICINVPNPLRMIKRY